MEKRPHIRLDLNTRGARGAAYRDREASIA